MRLTKTHIVLCVTLLSSAAAWAQPAPAAQPAARPAFTAPDDITFRRATIISEGTRMAAEVFALKSAGDKKLPTVLMAHGWGGTAAQLRTVALDFARAGYFVVTFDYRGWGESDSRVLLTGPRPAAAGGSRPLRYSAEVQEVREVVDPEDMLTDWLNAIHWLHGEPQCDTSRIGIWGSSYSGGHVVAAAARDRRVKALVSQVGSLDSRGIRTIGELGKTAYEDGTKRTRGEIGYPEPRARVVGNLQGGPIREKMLNYAPVDETPKADQCAMLFIIAEKEELFDNRDNGIKAHALAKGPKKLVTLPNITHYGVYLEARVAATKLAIDWFNEHLAASPKPPAAPAADVKQKLMGNWTLAKYEVFTQSSTPAPGYDFGRIMYDESGNMAAQLMRKGRPAITRESSDQDRLAAAAGYLAYYGKYEIDAAKGTVSHHVDGSTVTGWVGTALVRYYEFSPDGNTLILKLKNAEGRVTSQLTWERIK
jgi:uncharacterized protein